MRSRCTVTALVFTFGVMASASAQTLSPAQKQSCAEQIKKVEETKGIHGLMCSIWNDKDCRGLAIQRGLLASACMKAPLGRPE